MQTSFQIMGALAPISVSTLTNSGFLTPFRAQEKPQNHTN